MPKLTARIITGDTPTADVDYPPQGRGKDARETRVTGEIREIVIAKDGKSQFGIHILDNGEIILTDYGPMCFETAVPQNLRLVPTRPWS